MRVIQYPEQATPNIGGGFTNCEAVQIARAYVDSIDTPVVRRAWELKFEELCQTSNAQENDDGE